MQQYYRMKAKYRDAVLLFRVGDFYETFGEDAVKTSAATGIVLTRRNNGGSDIELAGFPYHAMDVYLPKLVRAGLRVAVCEQLEKPSKEKKIVRRGVTEVVTPGVTTDDKLLDQKSNNYLAAIHFGRADRIGLALADVSTGEFLAVEADKAYLAKLVHHYRPSEVLITKSQQPQFQHLFAEAWNTYSLEEWVFTSDYATERLQRQFSVANLRGFGIDDLPFAQIAAGAILHYLDATENARLAHFRGISRIHASDSVWLDQFTLRNLEIVQALSPHGRSLLQVLDDTVTPMGARKLRHWIQLPLLDMKKIGERHASIERFQKDPEKAESITVLLREAGDMERLLARAVVGKITPREMNQLARALESGSTIRDILVQDPEPALAVSAKGIEPCRDLSSRIRQAIQSDPPALLAKGDVIRDGFDQALDEVRHIIRNSKDILLQVQVEEARRTGIANLKIGFNNVFGYFLEVTNKYKNSGMIPEGWVRKQTTTNAERYVTDELKQLEERILGAEETCLARETELYEELVKAVLEWVDPIQRNADLLAQLDVLLGFARVSLKRQYTRPILHEGMSIEIVDGRHPVIEAQLPPGEHYIPNDMHLDPDQRQIMMITGPNMSGKSALLRQTALICLMAQMGCYVPATSARLGVVDKIFTRVGASDSISTGESTFMVEMNETASIMNNISDRSLVLLDEIGRGTATYDGISIAWAIAEFLHENGKARPKTLFATHYHELNTLAAQFPRISNYHVATQESGNRVLFLRKLLPGGIEHSFGIHVARMAGMPAGILRRASEILRMLESKEEGTVSPKVDPTGPSSPGVQLNFFDAMDPGLQEVRKDILDLELNQMTPIECLLKLQELKAKLQSEG